MNQIRERDWEIEKEREREKEREEGEKKGTKELRDLTKWKRDRGELWRKKIGEREKEKYFRTEKRDS